MKQARTYVNAKSNFDKTYTNAGGPGLQQEASFKKSLEKTLKPLAKLTP